MPCGFRQEDFFMFLPIKDLVKPETPEAGHLWPQGYNLNKLLDDTTYQKSRLYALWFYTRRIFHIAPYLNLCKICDPCGRAIFCAMAIIRTNLVQVC